MVKVAAQLKLLAMTAGGVLKKLKELF